MKRAAWVLALLPLAAVAQEVQRGEKIEVTGTNIRRVESETGLPVQVITRDDMERAGIQTAQDLVDRISAHQSVGGHNDARGIGQGNGSFQAASLRGLGADKTLVLLNGRRLAPYALSQGTVIDISSIPMAAIERGRHLGDLLLVQAGFHDHFAGELHARRLQSEPLVGIFAKGSEAAVGVTNEIGRASCRERV